MTKSTIVRGLVALSATAALGLGLAPAASANAPGQPGTPSAPTPIYTDNFENGMGDTATALHDYVGASGMTYSSDPAYDAINCNGLVVNFNSPQPATNLYGCNARANNVYPLLLGMAEALGNMPGGPADPAENHAVAAYTHEGTEPADAIVFQTNSPIPLTTANRFITFSVDGAVRTCEMDHPELKFYLLDGTTEIPAFDSAIDPCVGTPDANDIRTGSYAGNHALLFSGSQIGIRLRNGSTAGGTGNDFAFDNVKVLDVTPQLDTAFDAPAIQPGETSTLTFTITNTNELADKDGWHFDATLPAGVTVTGPGSTTCTAGTVTAPNGGNTVTVTGGDIASGVTSCTVTVPVTATDPGTYTLPSASVGVSSIDPPADAQLVVAPDAGAPMITWQAGTGIGAVLLLLGGGVLLLRRRARIGTATA